MAEYDIIHVEDEKQIAADMQEDAKKAGLSCKSLASLTSLQAALTDGDNAGVWVIDGSFPDADRGRPVKNAPNAIEAIRAVRQGARIILFSSSLGSYANDDLQGVEFVDKGEKYTDKLVPDIKKILGKI